MKKMLVLAIVLMLCLCLKPSFASWSAVQSYNFTYEPLNAGDYGTYYRGFEFIPNGTINVTRYNLSSANTLVNCSIIRNSTHVIVATSTVSANSATFNAVSLNGSEAYVMMCDADKFDYNVSIPSISTVQPHYNVTKCVEIDIINGYGNCPAGYVENVLATFETQQYSLPVTSINLYLNGDESNITIDNITALNSTALINASVWVAIDINGTLSANDTTTSTNLTNLSIGLWNITAYFNGDSSYNSSYQTYWVNVSEYIPPLNITNYTYAICSDNNTLYNHNYNFVMGIANYSDTYFYCAYGCDNTTFSCNPTILESAFYSFLFIIGIVIFILFIDRYILKGRH